MKTLDNLSSSLFLVYARIYVRFVILTHGQGPIRNQVSVICKVLNIFYQVEIQLTIVNYAYEAISY